MSGWWSAASASSPTAITKARAAAETGTDEVEPVAFDQPTVRPAHAGGRRGPASASSTAPGAGGPGRAVSVTPRAVGREGDRDATRSPT